MWTIPDKGEGDHLHQSVLFQEYLDALVEGICGKNCVLSGLAVTGGADMTPAVAKGAVLTNKVLKAIAAADVTIGAADSTNPRIDLIVVNSSGALAVRAGTAAANPKPPARTTDDVIIAAVYVGAGVTTIPTTRITDLRVMRECGPICIYRTTADETTNNTSSAIEILNKANSGVTIPSGLFLAGRTLRVRIGGNYLLNNGTPTVRLVIIYGGTTMYSQVTAAGVADADRGAIWIDFDICAQGNADQALAGHAQITDPATARVTPTTGVGAGIAPGAGVAEGPTGLAGAAAVDSDAANRLLSVQWTFSTGNAANEVVITHATVELIQLRVGSPDSYVGEDLVGDSEFPFSLSASANITASGENTTAQLTAPSGKSTSDFDAGRIQDDENPADAVDISSDDYTELEWCLKALAGAEDDAAYDFRIVKEDGTPLDTYTLYPTWTIGSAPTLVTPAVATGAGTAPAGTFTLAQTPPVASPAAVASLVYALSQIPGVAAGAGTASTVWARLQTPTVAEAAISALGAEVSFGTIVIPDVAAGAGGASVVWTLAQVPAAADISALASVLFTLGQVPARADGVALATTLYALAQTPGRAEGAITALGASASVATVVVPAAAIGAGTASATFALALTALAQALGSAEAPVYALVQVPARADAAGTAGATFLLRIEPGFAEALASALGAVAVLDLPGEPTHLAQVRIELFALPPVLRVAGAPDAALVAAGAPSLRLRDGPDAAEAIPGDAGGRVMP